MAAPRGAGDGALDVAQHCIDPFEPRYLGRIHEAADGSDGYMAPGSCNAGKQLRRSV